MHIRWSAFEVSRAMDEFEALIKQARPILEQARQKAKEAQKIEHLPEYMQGNLYILAGAIDGFTIALEKGIDRVRRDIPEKDLETGKSKPKPLGL